MSWNQADAHFSTSPDYYSGAQNPPIYQRQPLHSPTHQQGLYSPPPHFQEQQQQQRSPQRPRRNNPGYEGAGNIRATQENVAAAPLSESILDNEDAWIEIQKNTFTNWLNDQLKALNMSVTDLQDDLYDGVKLCVLVELLQKRQIGRYVRKPSNQHQFLENVNLALKAIADDDIKVVNIGSEDIVNGNLKLILGLIWSLILKYHIGRSSTKIPPKKLMLAWLNAVIPDRHIRNFNTDWNDGVALNGLIEYCKPGLSPNWRDMDPRNAVENCRSAMERATYELGIPPVLRAEDLSNPNLDEFSGMTYLSYFMKLDAPGYNATLGWTRHFLQGPVDNFTIDWNNGEVCCALANKCGARVKGWPTLDPRDEIGNCQRGIGAAAKDLDIEPLITAGEMATAAEEHLGVMAYAATFERFVKDGGQNRFDPMNAHISKLDNVQLKKPVDLKVTANGADKRRLKVITRAPSGREAQVAVNEANKGIFLAKFTPNELGVWQISVLYNDEHCNGSPFNISVYDPNGLRVYSIPDTCSLQKPVTFFADTAKAGDGQLTVDVQPPNGQKIPVEIQENGQRHFQCQFIPQEPGRHKIIVKYAGHHVPGSPFATTCVDHRKVTITGDGLGNVPVGREATFRVICDGSSPNDIQVAIKSANGQQLGCRRVIEGNSCICNYTPFEAGTHYVAITNAGQTVEGSPFTVKAYDISKVLVNNMPQKSKVTQPVDFDIDVSRAGIGNMEIMVNKGQVQCAVQSLGNRHFKATFIPERVGPHCIEITFNNQPVPGSPWTVDVEDLAPPPKITKNVPKLVQINEQLAVDIDAHPSKELKCFVTDPSGASKRGELVRLRDNLVKFQFVPKKVGLYVVELLYENEPIEGSPLQFMVFNPAGVEVGPIPIGVVNEPVEIPVDLRNAGEGEMEVQINKGTIAHKIERASEHSYNIYFTPDNSMDHFIDIKFNQVNVPGSPFVCEIFDPWKVRVDGEGINGSVAASVAVNFTIHMPVSPSALRDGGFQVKIITPSGEIVPAKVTQHGNDYRVEYVSKQVGRHTIEVFYANRPIQGSPFFVDVFDPTKVRIEALEDSEINEETSFEVHHVHAGRAELMVRVTSPSGRKVPHEMREIPQGHLVTYIPQEIGVHTIYITFGGYEIPGSPANQMVNDCTLPLLYGEGLEKGEEDRPCHFEVDARGMRGDLFVAVDGPNSVAKCVISPEDEPGIYSVSYIPVEVGIFDVHVKWNQKDVDHSPFHPRIVNPAKVEPLNTWSGVLDQNGIIRLVPRQLKKIDFTCANAGPGELAAEVWYKGKKVPVMLQKVSIDEQIYSLSFTPEEEGNYELKLWFGDIALPRFPIPMICEKQGPKFDISKVTFEGDCETAIVNEENSFLINGGKAGQGQPSVKITNSRGEQVKVVVEQIKDRVFECRFIPRSIGKHVISILWEGQQVPGSPIKCQVVSSTDPGKVFVNTENFAYAELGKELTALIDVRAAGPGELTAHCMGPSKPAYCQLYDHVDGTFTLSIKPQEAGRHTLQIRYNGEHIPGSPFLINVIGPPDASKVKVSGPGIEHGFLSKYKSEFVCDTRGAGLGTLAVRVRGPKGAFLVEMQRDSEEDRQIVCRYDPKEPGDYVIHVKWAGEHVTGSPYHVQIFENREELEDFIAETEGLQYQENTIYRKQQQVAQHRSRESYNSDYRYIH